MGQTAVHRKLVVFDEIHLSLEFWVEVVLTLAVEVALLCHSCGVALVSVSEAVCSLIVLAEIIVECVLSVSSSVSDTQTARRVRDVGVATSTVVDVYDGLGVNVGQVVAWALFEVIESS